ncbi:MAG: acetylxylan esterase, partial [Planctomycetota bacterium]|nr:acetylxylan esterase [Planctomycetota bacterium]
MIKLLSCYGLGFGLLAWCGIAVGQSSEEIQKKKFDKLVSVVWETAGNGVFSSPKQCAVNAKIKLKNTEAIHVEYQWEIQNERFQPIKQFEIGGFVLSAKNDSVTLSKRYSPLSPGFSQFVLRVRIREKAVENLAGWAVVKKFRVGYQPEKIKYRPSQQADFNQFWKESKNELAKVKPEFSARIVEEKSDGDYRLYEVEMRSYGGVRVGGWLEVPRGDSAFPCLLRVPGYSQAMKPVGKEKVKGLAVFSFNIRGHGNSQKDVPGQPGNYWIRGLDDKKDYFYRGAYLDCIRAVEFLKSRSFIDPKRIAVRGG